MHKIYVQNIHVQSQPMGWNNFKCLVVNWRLCAVLEVEILLLRRYWEKNPSAEKPEKICSESVFEVSGSPVTFNVAFLTALFRVWVFCCFHALVAWLKNLCCVRNGEREKVVGKITSVHEIILRKMYAFSHKMLSLGWNRRIIQQSWILLLCR